MNQVTLVPRTLKALQTTLHIRLDHFSIVENSRVSMMGWHFYNAKWAGQDVVISLSNKDVRTTKSLPLCITLYPVVKFTDIIPSRLIKEEPTGGETNGE